MDQPGHLARSLHYRHFSLCNPISIKNKTGNCKFVRLNKIKLSLFQRNFFHNYNQFLPDRLLLVHFIYSHKFSTCCLILYTNGVTQIKNAGRVGI